MKENPGGAGLTSKWEWEHWRGGELLDRWTEHNRVTDEGLEHLLDVAFSDATQITDWYVAIFEDDHTPAYGDTYAVPGYTESTAYDEATRPAWTEAGVEAGDVAGKKISNSAAKASFTINATKTIYGGALVGGGTAANTKADAAGGGTLYCASAFSSGSKAVEDDDVLKVSITITAKDEADV